MKCIAVVMFGLVAAASAGVLVSEPITQYSSIPASTVITQPGVVETRTLPVAQETVVEARSLPYATSYGLVRSAPYTPTVYTSDFYNPTVYSAPAYTPTVYAAPAYAPSVEYVRSVAPVVEVRSTPTVSTVIPGEAKYTAVNRGAVHEAPLPGHALSQTSLNLAPAA